MFIETNKSVTLNEATKFSKASSLKKRKRDSVEKTIPMEVLQETTSSVGTPAEDVPSAKIVPAVPQVQTPQPLETEVDLEQVGEDIFVPADIGEGGSHSAGPSSPHPMEEVPDLSLRSNKGKEKNLRGRA